MDKIMADYVKLPKFDEYKEWFKDHFDLYRENGILQVTMKTNDGPMFWSGSSHRAMSQLSRVLSMDSENEILIWTHKGDNLMMDKDPNGWETAQERFDHQYIDDYNLIKNMIFDLDIPTIGAIPGPGFHWDSAILCDITIASEDVPRETRTIQSHLCKRPLERLLVNDLKLHTVSEQYSTMVRLNAKDYGKEGVQTDEKDMSLGHHYVFTPGENEYLTDPIKNWDDIRKDMKGWAERSGYISNPEERYKSALYRGF